MATPNRPPEKPAEPATGTPEGQDQGDKQARRDARVRGELRDLQGQHAALSDRYERLVQAEVHRQLAYQVGDVSAALKIADRSATDFVTADGAVDAEALGTFANEFLAAHPQFDNRLPAASGDGQRRVTREKMLRQDAGSTWAHLLGARPDSTPD